MVVSKKDIPVAMPLTDSSSSGGELEYERTTVENKGILATLREQPNLMWVILVASGGGFLFGNDIGYIGPILEFDSFKETMSDNEPISPTESALIVGTFSIGAVLGALPFVSAFFIEKVGRKWSIFIGSVIFLIGAIWQAASTSLIVFYFGRIVDGFSIGILSVVVPIYQAEVSPPHVRGAMGTMYQLSITFGILVANLCDWAVENDPNWWLAMIPQIVFSACLAVLAVFLPKSPRFQLMTGNHEGAYESLSNLRRGSTDHAIKKEYRDMASAIDEEAKAGVASYSEIWNSSFMFRFTCVGILLQLGQQFTGINALMYFGPTIFKSAGVEPIVFQVIQASVNFASTFPAIYMVDRLGRKFLFLVGAIGMTVCFTIIGSMGAASLEFPDHCYGDTFRSDNRVACSTSRGLNPVACIPDAEAFGRDEFTDSCPVTFDDVTDVYTPGYTEEQCACGAEVEDWFKVLMIIFTFVFIFFFASGWGPVAWVYTSEIYPTRFRGKIVGITTMSNWLGNTGIAFMTPVLLDSIQFYTFIIFAACNGFLILYSIWLPETKDIPLENILEKFEKRLGEWKEKDSILNKNLDDLKAACPCGDKCACGDNCKCAQNCDCGQPDAKVSCCGDAKPSCCGGYEERVSGTELTTVV